MSTHVHQGMTLQLQVDGYGRLGEALSRYEGTRVFVFGGVSGEEVIAEVVSSRRGYIAARVNEVVRGMPERTAVQCPYFGHCTGCQWQHIAYPWQLQMKRDLVVRAMQEDGDLNDSPVAEVVPADQIFYYRNHARFTVDEGGSLGFINRESRQFVHIEHCMLMHHWINGALSNLQGQCSCTTQVSIRYGINTGKWLIQPSMENIRMLKVGQQYLEEQLHNYRFRISSPSFFQVNTLQAEKMVDIVKEKLMLKGGEVLVDAYAGVGTYSALLAPYAGRIYAVEEAASAVADAEVNFSGLNNIVAVKARTEDFLTSFSETIHAIIINPSRSGCQSEVIDVLKARPPERIVYVSCNPRTLARDLKLFCGGPFVIGEIIPVDLFPNTVQVENVVTLMRK